jgi:hypothetical protein
VSLRGAASAALVVAGGLGLLPVPAFAQTAAPAPASAPAIEPSAEPALTAEAAEPDEAQQPCAPAEEPEQTDTLTQEEAEPATASAAAEGVEAHCSQNAGNQQYEDPFAGTKPPGEGGNGGSSQNGSGGGTGSPSTGTTSSGEVVAAQDTVAGTETGIATDPAGPSLPNTGLGLGGLVGLGLPLLAAGIALRARLA